VVAQLEARGYVQRVGDAPAEADALLSAQADEHGAYAEGAITVDSVEERTLLTLAEARRRAVRELTDRLGPDASTMSIRIEQCGNADELRDRLREAERLVAGLLGEAAAQDFVRSLRRR
jgi:hypothetical protein